ncbi:hypothetical protein [Halospeciosus flavus]|uniref:Uncharacterized protein n=1 Tax=Halospeciosus flavus TaxID=3032283 RepID=A0ABD5Z9E2_9EURY
MDDALPNIRITITEVDTTPQMWVSAGDLEIPKSGHIEFEPTYFAFVGNNVMPAGVPQPLTDFITEYDLATTVEVMKALDTEQAQLKNSEKVQQVCLGVLGSNIVPTWNQSTCLPRGLNNRHSLLS